ncbi:hypothetical protein Q5752_004705 [Cryptotrichosporon argae]
MVGSTAPAIASPLLAWPARPSPRFSPSSPSSPDFASAAASAPASQRYARSTSVPTEARALSPRRGARHPTPDVYVHAAAPDRALGTRANADSDDDDDEGGLDGDVRPEYAYAYAPPARPLNPHQLGRIAQSFGIVVPHLPHTPALSPSASASPVLSGGAGACAASPVSSIGALGRARSATPYSPLFASHYLLTVVPPLVLLPPSPMPDTTARAQRWRRGRLLPLQPTLGAMLVTIAREFGLPATTGIAVYLVQAQAMDGGRRDSLSFEAHDDDDVAGAGVGPLVSAATWAPLFASYIHGAPSLASTPSTTPHRAPRSATASTTQGAPPSPLSLASGRQGKASAGHAKSLSGGPGATPVKAPSQSSLSSVSSLLPVTPSSLTPATSASACALAPASPALPIVGTIEFDIDPDDAPWFDDWQRAGGPSRRAARLESHGVRELRLVGKLNDARPRFLREVDTARANAVSGYAALDSDGDADVDVDEDDEGDSRMRGPSETSMELVVDGAADDDPLADMFPSAAAEFAALRAGRAEPGRRLSIRDIGTDRALSASASMSALEDDDNDVLEPEDDVADVRRMLGDAAVLASPIALGAAHLDDERRGSGLVMADQLDSLEKIMRDLSPREIRLTSPRHLTPRTATKIGLAGLTVDPSLAPPPPARLAKPTSPLAGTFIGPNGERTSPVPGAGVPGAAAGRPAWPAVPFAQISEHGSPGSPGSIHDYFRRDALPSPTTATATATGGVSTETRQRMQAALPPPKTVASEWKPPRRPSAAPVPGPGPEHAHSPSSSPAFAAVRTPDMSAVAGPSGAARPSSSTPEESKRRTRAGSISLRGLRSRSSRRSDKDRDRADAPDVPVPAVPAMPHAHPRTHAAMHPHSHSHSHSPSHSHAPASPGEPVGLFRGASVEAAHASSFTGLRASHDAPAHVDGAAARPSLSEFGHLDAAEHEHEHAHDRPASAASTSTVATAATTASASLPAKSRDKDGFASRFFSFGARRKEAGAHAPPPAELAEPAGPALGSGSGRRKSRRSPSNAGVGTGTTSMSISAPVGLVKHDLVLPPSAQQHAELGRAPRAPLAHGRSPSLAAARPAGSYARDGDARDEPASPTTPTSPASAAGTGSPRNVRRKPVPHVVGVDGVRASPSLASVVSVLDARAH